MSGWNTGDNVYKLIPKHDVLYLIFWSNIKKGISHLNSVRMIYLIYVLIQIDHDTHYSMYKFGL